MPIRGTITYVGGPEATLKEFRAGLKEELADLGARWHERALPKHFLPSAVGEYGFQPRARGYCIAKARAKHHQNPLEWSGRMKAQVLRMARITAVATKVRTGVSVILTGPRYLYAYRKDLKQADKAAELTATTTAEIAYMADRLDARLTARMNNCKEKSETAAK